MKESDLVQVASFGWQGKGCSNPGGDLKPRMGTLAVVA